MSHPAHHHEINYIEFASTDIERRKKFYGTVFGWSFVDYGPDYASFTAARRASMAASTKLRRLTSRRQDRTARRPLLS